MADLSLDLALVALGLVIATIEHRALRRKYHTNLSATKKNVVVYDPKTGIVSNENINDVYHGAGHKSISRYHSDQSALPSKVQ